MRAVVALGVVGAALVVAVGAHSQAGQTDLWVIYDGPGAGAIVATPAGAREVRQAGPSGRAQNVPPAADGQIADGSETNPFHANCDKLHYHGNLFRSGDPAPNGCGWGRVIKRSVTSTELGLAADAFMAEIEAHALANVAAGAPFDVAATLEKLRKAIRNLDGLDITLTRRDEDELAALVGRIRELDATALDALLDIRDGRGDRAENHRGALRALAEAFPLKRQLIAALVSKNLVAGSAMSDLRLTLSAPARVLRERTRFEFGRRPTKEFEDATIKYAVTVRNLGPADSPPSTIVFRVNRPLRFWTQSPRAPWRIMCSARRTVAVFTCRVSSLPSGASHSVFLHLLAQRPATHTARATVVGPNADPVFENNGQTRTTTVANKRR